MNLEAYKPSLNPVSVVLEPHRAVADPGERPTPPPPLISRSGSSTVGVQLYWFGSSRNHNNYMCGS